MGVKPSQALAEIPLLMAGLEIPGRHVVDNGIAEHIVKGLCLRDVFASLPKITASSVS